MDIGDAKLQVSAEGVEAANAKLQGLGSSVKDMSGQFRAAGIAIAAMGTAIVGALALSVKSVMELGDEIQKMSLRTDLAMETLSELSYMAELSGSSLDAVGKGIKTLQKALVEASDGMATYADEFKRIGLNIDELMAMSPEEQFWAVAKAIAAMENPTIRSAVAQTLLGRAGFELLPMLAQGAEGIDKMRESAQKFAPIIDTELGNAMADLKDRLSEVGMGFKKIGIAITSALIPYLMPLVEKIKDIIHSVAEWMKAHPGLTKALVLLAAVLGVFMFALGTLLIILPTIIGPLAMLAGVGGIAGLGAAFAGLMAPIAGVIGALSGIILPVLAVAAVITALILIGKLIVENWEAIKERAKIIWDGIVDFFKTLPGAIGNIFAKIGDFMLAPIRNAVNGIIGAINWMIEQYNKLPWGDISEISWRFPELSSKAPLADTGGVFRGPGAVKIGDLDEVMVPVGKGVMGNTYNIEINTDVLEGNDQSARRWARTMMDYMREDLRRVGSQL